MARGLPDAPRWARAVMAVSVAAIVGMSYFAANRPEPPGFTAPPAGAEATADPLRVLVVGDSYTEGTALGGQGAAGWPQLLAADLAAAGEPVTVDVVASGGSGYAAGGPTGRTFVDLAEAAAGGYDVVVFFGSRNDTAPPAKVQEAAETAYATTREKSPEAALLVIGPPWVDADPPSTISAARDGVAAATASSDGVFVDPLAEGWFVDRPELIGSDGVHPTDAGHRYLADLITPHVRDALV